MQHNLLRQIVPDHASELQCDCEASYCYMSFELSARAEHGKQAKPCGQLDELVHRMLCFLLFRPFSAVPCSELRAAYWSAASIDSVMKASMAF